MTGVRTPRFESCGRAMPRCGREPTKANGLAGWASRTVSWPTSGTVEDHLRKWRRARGFSHALLLGMGGSSLGPEVMKMTFGKIAGYP